MKNSLTRLLLIIALTVASLSVYSQPVNQVFEEWVTSDGTQNYFIKAAVETDGDGFVYVAGATLNNAGNYDLLVSKYDAEGNVLWTDQYDGTGNGDDAAVALAVDANGYVFVTGTTFTSSTDTLDVVTIGYDDTGNRDWLEVYSGADELADFGTCIAVTNNAVYVGGSATSTSDGLDFLALKYNLSGVLQWDTQQDFNSLSDVCTKLTLGDKDMYLAGATNTTGFDWDMLTMSFDMTTGTFGSDATASGGSVGFAHVRAMDRDLDGNIYLTGTVANMSTGYDIHTVKIDTFMNVVWDVDYSSSGNHDDEGNALAIDPSNGNVYVGGFKDVSGQGTDFVTLMYNDAGSLQWSAMWNDTADGGDTVKALVVDGNGNVTVTGSAWNGSSLDYHTIQYDDTGTLLWERSFNDKYNFTDAPMDIALTSDNGVVVTGQSLNPDSTWSYVTVKYLAHEFILPVDSDSVSTSLRWLANRDQLLDTDTNLVERVKYYSNQCYPNLYFMDDTLSYVFFQGVDTSNADTLHRIDMTFNGANAAQKLLPMDKESYWNNYYLGHIPEGRPFVSLHDRLVKQEVWPNIDVVYSSNQRGLKYYIVVHPGGETGAISLEYHGYDALSVDGNEALVIESSIGELVQPQALAYEMDANGELDLLAWQPEYKVSGGEVVFEDFGDWDGDLVIEVNWGYLAAIEVVALRAWSTYFGGTSNDFAYDIAIDPIATSENLYVVGITNSLDFPVRGSSVQSASNGGTEVFIAVFNDVHDRIWVTYFGGTGDDFGYGIAHDPLSQTVFICGETNSDNTGLPQRSYGSSSFQDILLQGYLAGFDENSGARNWVTGFGGETTICNKIEIDTDGNIFVVGKSGNYSNLATCTPPPGFFPICGPGSEYVQQLNGTFTSLVFQDGFIAKFSNTRALMWSTFFGGDRVDDIHGLAIDNTNDLLYVVGSTRSSSDFTSEPFPILDDGGYYQEWANSTNYPGNLDGFIAKFSLTGDIQSSTFFGGEEDDQITGIAVSSAPNSEGYLMICGNTSSSNYATLNTVPGSGNQGFPHFKTGSSYDESFGGGNNDPFVAMFDDKTQCIWSTYLGGAQDEGSHFRSPDISVTESGAIYVGGFSYSGSHSSTPFSNFSSHSSFLSQPIHADVSTSDYTTDSYVFRFNDNADFQFGTFYGGKGNQAGSSPNRSDVFGGIACDDERVFITGGTFSTSNFPIQRPFPASYIYGQEGFPASTNSSAFLAQIQKYAFVSSDHPKEQNTIIVVFPNPGTGRYTLLWECEHTERFVCKIHNAMGHEIVQTTMQGIRGSNSQQIDLAGYPAGVYIVKLIGKSGEFWTKLIML
jgi:hypothetical protein